MSRLTYCVASLLLNVFSGTVDTQDFSVASTASSLVLRGSKLCTIRYFNAILMPHVRKIFSGRCVFRLMLEKTSDNMPGW